MKEKGLRILIVANIVWSACLVLENPVRRKSLNDCSASITNSLESIVLKEAPARQISNLRSTGFRWSQLESTNYYDYIHNLRQIGCPEQTIIDIITADVHAGFAAQTSQRAGGTKPQVTESTFLSLEEQEVLAALLGTNCLPHETPRSDRYVYVDLLESKRSALADWSSAFATKFQQILAVGQDRELTESEWSRLAELQTAQIAALKEILSPRELGEYELLYSATAQELRTDLEGIEVTDDEFRHLFRLREREVQEMPALVESDSAEIAHAKTAFEEGVHNILGDRFSRFRQNRAPAGESESLGQSP